MSDGNYSTQLCLDLERITQNPRLHCRHRPLRYEPGHVLDVEITTVCPAVHGRARVRLEKFLGGGFAGQVYRSRIEALDLPTDQPPLGLDTEHAYAVKLLIPPTPFICRFRDTLYWLAYQGPFSAQVSENACRAGLLWQKLIRRACGVRFGREDAVKDAHATFFEPGLGAWGEITEWIEGRTWLLETDPAFRQRRAWRTVDLAATHSAEYVAKRRFMTDLVALLHDLGASEFARQYEWWTLKSQPNVLKRTGPGYVGPAAGLCAVDFRAGLALLPFLPMSPADFRLIVTGLLRRGVLVQFDRGDLDRLDAFIAQYPAQFADLAGAVAELKCRDRAYRRSLPDVTHQGLRLLVEPALRADVRQGLVAGYAAADLVDAEFAGRLHLGGARFAAFYLLGGVPFLGRWLRRLWGNAAYRRHLGTALRDDAYLRQALAARAATTLTDWHRTGRLGEAQARALARQPLLVLMESLLVGAAAALGPLAAVAGTVLLFGHYLAAGTIAVGAGLAAAGAGALPGLYRMVTDPRFTARRIGEFFGFIYLFYTREPFREHWFLEMLATGEKRGMLSAEERAAIAARVRDPFIVKYLRSMAIHFATLPVSEIVTIVACGVAVGWCLAHGQGWEKAALVSAATAAAIQLLPFSPGSLCRGAYVLYLMVRERNLRDYIIAAPVSLLKGIGYVAFPLQMTAAYPRLAQFLAGMWASSAVRIVPVFGEKGALLEHWAFDVAFNLPLAIAQWCRPRLKALLTVWLAAGVALAGALLWAAGIGAGTKAGINIILAAVCLFVLPRVLFYPLLTRPRR